MKKQLFITFLVLPLLSFAQVFTFLKPTIIDTAIELKPDTFQFILQDLTIVIKGEGSSIVKFKNNKPIDSSTIDFGSYYHIYNAGYLLKNKRIYFLFFIKENGKNYTALYSFKINNFKRRPKRLHFINCFDLKSSTLNGDILKLEFTNKTYNINLSTGLQEEDKFVEIE
jgi:hypothetical protein